MLLLAGLMVSSISYPKIRDIRAMALFGLIFLAAGWLIFRQNDILYAALLVIMVIILYLASPVVITRLQKRK
jgi:phosphatidylserine synthase